MVYLHWYHKTVFPILCIIILPDNSSHPTIPLVVNQTPFILFWSPPDGRRVPLVKIIVGVFLVLHGLVHLLYFGQSARLFELQPGLAWPDGSWAFSKLLGENGTRTLADILCIIAAAGFVIGASGIFLGQSWWRTAIITTTVFSSVLYVLFWNGRFQQLPNQGGVGLLIDVAILISILVLRWPQFDF